MKREFTKLMAALALLLFIAPLGMWGQSRDEVKTTYVFNTKAWGAKIGSSTANWTSKKDGNQYTSGQGIQITTGTSGACGNSDISYSNVSKITVTYCTNASKGKGSIAWYNVSSNTADAQSGTLVGSQSITAPSSNGTTLRSFDIIPSNSQTGFIQLYATCTTNSIYVYSIEITTVSGGGDIPTPDPSDFALTGTTALTFDLYNDNGSKTISYTTSSNGTVSVADNDYVNATVDQQAKTITVTPVAVTNGNQTINVTQSATSAYEAGEASFTVNITDSSPAPTYIFNTNAGLTALGITIPSSGSTDLDDNHDYVSGVVTMNITHGTTHTRVWAGTSATDLRVYGGGGSLTFSVPSGQQITSIILVGEAPNNFDEISSKAEHTATWSGTPNRTVTLTANNTCKINTITVVYEANASGVDTPVLPASCDFQTEKEITITGITAGATVYYTTDNTNPETSSTRVEYTAPFTINATTTVKAVAYLNSNYSTVAEATYTRVYNITVVQPNGGTISASPVQAAAEAEITLTATANVGYAFGSWSVTPSSVTVASNQFVMPASDVTVTATFTTTTAYTVSFSVNNKVEMTATVNSGNSIDLTKFVAEGNGYTFEGWSTTAGGENIDPQNAYTPTGNITLYPGVNPAPSADEYTLVTNVSQLEAGNLVVIAAHGTTETAMGMQDDNNRPEVTITKNNNNTISWESNVDVSELTLGTVTSDNETYWTLYDPEYSDGTNTGGYLYAVASSNKNYLRTQHENNADGYWTISIASNNNATITANGTNTSSRKLQRNASAHIFSTYTSNQQAVYLYTKPAAKSAKGNRDGVPTTSKVTGIAANVLVTVKSNGIVYLTGSNAGNAANLVVEDGGQLVTSANVAGTMLKHINGYSAEKDNYYLISHPLASNANPENVLNMLSNEYDLYYFKQNAVDQVEGEDVLLEWRNYHNDSFNMFVGSGYLYANSEDVDLEFAGQLRKNENEEYDQNITYVSGFRFSGWNLVGNPFPSNAKVNMSFYKMNSTSDGINNIAMSANSVIAPMEGVFVVTDANDQVTFTATTAAVTTNAKKSVNIDVKRDNELMDRAIVSFNGSTLSKLNLNENATKVYFQQGQEEFAIVAADNEGELPVNFKASRNGRYTMSINVEDLDMNYLHLIDNKTGNDVDLLATPSYTFEASNNDYESRFRLVFNANAIEENDTEANTTFAYYNGSEWIINNPSTGSGDNATLQVVDMMGRVLSSETLNGNANVTLNQPAGIYMLRLINGENVKVQKVVVR